MSYKKLIFVLLVISLLSLGCNQPPKDNNIINATDLNQLNSKIDDRVVRPGDLIQVDYAGSFENGEIFDTSIEKIAKDNNLFYPSGLYTPIEFRVGTGRKIPGFDAAVIGMKQGEEKTIVLQPKDAYGLSDSKLIQKVDKNALQSQLPPFITIKEGLPVMLNDGIEGKVLSVDENSVTIDFNDRMVGKVLIFYLKIVKIITP